MHLLSYNFPGLIVKDSWTLVKLMTSRLILLRENPSKFGIVAYINYAFAGKEFGLWIVVSCATVIEPAEFS